MKAHVPTKQERLSLLERTEIDRINKLWLVMLNQEFDFDTDRLERAFVKVCELAGELYEDPEYWIRVDELLIDKQKLKFIRHEDIDEREKVALQVHKQSGKKWRVY